MLKLGPQRCAYQGIRPNPKRSREGLLLRDSGESPAICVHLADNEKAAARSFEESAGTNSVAGSILPLAHRKDVVFTQGQEIAAYIDGNVYVKHASFQSAKNPPNPVAKGAPNPQ